MTVKLYPALIALLLAAPAAAAPGSVTDFKLRPAPSPSQSPQVQGPVDTDGPVPIAPRAIPTAKPNAPSGPAPSVTATPVAQPTARNAAERQADVHRFTPAARATVQPGRQPVEAAPSSSPAAPDTFSAATSQEAPEAQPSDGVPESGQGPTETVLAQVPLDDEGFDYSFWAALAAALAVLGAAYVAIRTRKQAVAGPASFEPLQAAPPAPAPPPMPTDGAAAAPDRASAALPIVGPTAVKVTPDQLGRSVMQLTFGCTITLHADAMAALHNPRISADMVTAHSTVPVDEQVATATTPLPLLEHSADLQSGVTGAIKASLTLPVSEIRPIRQGMAVLYVPLLRLRVEADNIAPIVQTYVIGMPSPDTDVRLQPFRLDEMPQIYRQVGIRALN